MEKLTRHLDYDPETGIFRWKDSKIRNARKGQIAGRVRSDGYIVLQANWIAELGHRVAWYMTHGTLPKNYIDHINGDKGDNRISNLRDVPMTVNGVNRKGLNLNNSSGVSGVSYHRPRNKWRARYIEDGKMHHIGTFATKEQAEQALIQYKLKQETPNV